MVVLPEDGRTDPYRSMPLLPDMSPMH